MTRPSIICECGFVVTGTSEKHATSNFETHKNSNVHKKFMKAKKDAEKQKVRINNETKKSS